jgi:hypothetical protein
MSQPTGQPVPGSKSIPTSISVGLILITILSLALVGYTALNPHLSTVTQQQFLTNTQTLYSTETNTQTQTVTSIGTQTVTSVGTQTVTSTTTTTSTSTAGYGYNGYQNCGSYGCYSPGSGYYFNGNYYTTCQSTGTGNTFQCSGYLYQNSNGCIELVVPVFSGYNFESPTYQYYTLRNLPSSHPPVGAWVTVNGQLYQGYNPPPNAPACPGNYINVTSISQ